MAYDLLQLVTPRREESRRWERRDHRGYAKGENGHVCTPRTEAMSSNLYNVSPYFDYM